MTKFFISTTLFLLIKQFAMGQITSTCNDLLIQSNQLYDIREYVEALTIFNKVISNKCTLNQNEFYNGACIASLGKNKKLALEYLQLSIQNGFDDTTHMSKDTDLDYVRNTPEYLKIVRTISNKIEILNYELKNINIKNVRSAIPYRKGLKWGWLNEVTLSPLTRAIFDYADFKSGKGLYFVYNSKQYIYNNDFKVEKVFDNVQNSGVPSRMENDFENYNDTSRVEGFIVRDNEIIKFSKSFSNVILVKESNSSEQLGIATNSLNKKGIINNDGTIYKNFNFKYTDLRYFLGRFKNTYFITKSNGEENYKIIDRNGILATNESFNLVENINNYQVNPIKQNIFIGYPKLLKVMINGKENVLDKITLSLLLHKNYEKILMFNGPTDDQDRTGNSKSYGLYETYFLVKEGENIFYINEKGKELKVE